VKFVRITTIQTKYVTQLKNKKIKYIARFVDRKYVIRVVTSHVYGILYYSAPVWLTEQTKNEHWRLLNSVHYRALRVGIGDYTNKVSRHDLDLNLKRVNPHQWMAYCCSKLAIVLTNLKNTGPRMSKKLQERIYVNDRTPGRGTFADHSRLKIGRNAFPNRLKCLNRVKFDWINGIGNHVLRVNLKKTFISA